ncbi:MAG: pyridoxal-phosphate dependent enzyme, partial [Blastocatellia bacterium]
MKTQTSVPPDEMRPDDMRPDDSEPAVVDPLKAIQEEHGVFAAIGGTPMVRLARVIPNLPFNLYAKLEFLNPGGSIKDRVAFSIIRKALENGDIGPHSVVIESSSGNMGIGLAQLCAYYGLRFICVVDSKTTSQNIRLLEAYGAEVDMVSVADSRTGEFLQARIERVKFLLHSVENAFWPNQYAN